MQRVVLAAAFEVTGAASASKRIGPATAHEMIGAVVALQRVIPGATSQVIVAAVTNSDIRQRAFDARVDAKAATIARLAMFFWSCSVRPLIQNSDRFFE